MRTLARTETFVVWHEAMLRSGVLQVGWGAGAWVEEVVGAGAWVGEVVVEAGWVIVILVVVVVRWTEVEGVFVVFVFVVLVLVVTVFVVLTFVVLLLVVGLGALVLVAFLVEEVLTGFGQLFFQQWPEL